MECPDVCRTRAFNRGTEGKTKIRIGMFVFVSIPKIRQILKEFYAFIFIKQNPLIFEEW